MSSSKAVQSNGGAAGSASVPAPAAARSIKDLINVRTGRFAGIIQDMDDFQAVEKEHAQLLNEMYRPTHEESLDHFISPNALYPTTREEHVALIGELFEAIVDFEAVEKETYQTKRVRAFSDIQVEIIAWTVLKALKEVHDGKLGIPPWAGEDKTDWYYERFYSFADRFLAVRESLRRSKSMAYNIIATPFAKRLAAAPAHELQSKTSNQVLNDRKAKRLATVKSNEAKTNANTRTVVNANAEASLEANEVDVADYDEENAEVASAEADARILNANGVARHSGVSKTNRRPRAARR